VSEGLFRVSAEPGKGRSAPFNAYVGGSIGASFGHFRCWSEGYPVLRPPRDIARLGWDDYVFLHREKGADVPVRERSTGVHHQARRSDGRRSDAPVRH
jgi:hypothetical protein